jgi:16S rRNA (cytidine1402-2'-O)-methyltransferase
MQHPTRGTLSLVAVPIGNLDDLTIRARELLRTVTVVAAEDTRHFATLARHHGLATRAVSYHAHNEEARAAQLVARLLAGDDVALVTDAGTPLVSDPGLALVRAALAAGIRVTALPGASAVTTALAASGLAPLPFRFIGFPARTATRRRAQLADLAGEPDTLVAFEAPHRLRATLTDALDVLGDRPACLARSMTKRDERYRRGTLASLVAELAGEGTVRGECTLVIAGSPTRPEAADAASDAAMLAASGASVRTTAEYLARRHGLARRRAYELASEAQA